jgi:ketosteroid isomerase-like protein
VKRCVSCNIEYSDETAFCRECGSQLQSVASAPPAAPVQSSPTPAAAGTAAAPPAAAPPQAAAVPEEMRAKLGGSSSALWGALAVVSMIAIGGFGWLLGRSRQVPAESPSTQQPIIVMTNPTAAPSTSEPSSASPINSSVAANTPPTVRPTTKPTPKPDPDIQERAGVLRTVENWRSAWERQNISDYMANYAPDAQIYSNRKWYSRDAFEEHERDLFSYGGTLSITRGYARVKVNGDTAEVSFPFTFQRRGGKGNYKSRGRQAFKMRKNDAGEWAIVEDIFSK